MNKLIDIEIKIKIINMLYFSIFPIDSKLIFAIALSCFLGKANAIDTSGAVVWWMLLVIVALAAGSAYLFYLVYILKKPLGTNRNDADLESSKHNSKSLESFNQVNRVPRSGIERASNYILIIYHNISLNW